MPIGKPRDKFPHLYENASPQEAVPTPDGSPPLDLPPSVKPKGKKKSSAKAAADDSDVAFSLGEDVPEEALTEVGRLPVVLTVKAGCYLIRRRTGGKVELMPVLDEARLERLVDRPFRRLCQGMKIRLSPGWAYVIGCSVVSASTLAAAMMTAAEVRGIDVPTPESLNHAPQSQAAGGESPPDAVQEQPGVRQQPAA